MSAGGRPTSRRPGRARAVVVGGGISGLSAAWELLKRDDVGEVLVLERATCVGGVLAAGELGGCAVDLGAEALLARRPEAVGLAHELGLTEQLVTPATTSARVRNRGRLLAMPGGTVMGVPRSAAALASFLDEQELARAAAEPSQPAPGLEQDVDVASWVSGRFGQAVVDRLVEPLLGGVYAGHASRLSLRATLPALWPMARRGGSVLEAFAREDEARLSPPESTGRESTGRGSMDPPPVAPLFAGIDGGVNRLASRLAEALLARGVNLRLGVTVRGLERGTPGFRVLTGPTTAAERVEADLVVIAVPAPAAARLLGGVAPGAAAVLAEVETASMVLVSALVDGRALPEDSTGSAPSGLLVPPVEGLTIKAATFSSVKWPWMRPHLPPGTELVRVSLGRAGEQTTLQRDDQELTALALRELATVLAVGDQAVPGLVVHETRVDRWGGALPQYAVDHVEAMQRVRAAVAEVPGLGIAGSVLDGVGVPACIAAAGAAVAQAIDTLPAVQRHEPRETMGR